MKATKQNDRRNMKLDDWIAECKRIEALATIGPWRSDWVGTHHYELTSNGDQYWIIRPGERIERGEDLDFMAFSRSALPLAVKMIEESLREALISGGLRLEYFLRNSMQRLLDEMQKGPTE